MADSISVSMEFSGNLRQNIARGEEKLRRAALVATQSMAPRVESHMKLNAPWDDQTGNARNGLAARAYQERKEYGILLYHQVPYGIWLETRWSGKYAIIQPTIDKMSPAVMRSFDRILERL